MWLQSQWVMHIWSWVFHIFDIHNYSYGALTMLVRNKKSVWSKQGQKQLLKNEPNLSSKQCQPLANYPFHHPTCPYNMWLYPNCFEPKCSKTLQIHQNDIPSHFPSNSFVMVKYKTFHLKHHIVFVKICPPTGQITFWDVTSKMTKIKMLLA